VTSVTSLAKGYDPRYLSEGQAAGHAGGTRYYADAAGEPPGRWGGRAAARLGLQGEVDAKVLQALYMDRVGPDGQRLDARQRAKYRPAEERVDAAVAAHQAAHPFATEGDLVLVRAGESGSTVTAALRALAAESRTSTWARTEGAVRRAGVWVLAPLGLCFLPAFVCLGVVPLVLGIAGDVFR